MPTFKSPYFSNNQKVGVTLDFPRKESNCINSCIIKDSCYIEYNIQDKINPKYRKKIKKNFKLSLTNKFIHKISNEILKQNWLRVRIFSNGDIIYNDFKKSTKQLDNIFGVALKCKNNRFWLVTRNCNALMYYFDVLNNPKPENINIMLSIDGKEKSKSLLTWCKLHKIQPCIVTDKKKISNCKASINHKSCIENNCVKCFEFEDEIRYWLIHGKGSQKFKDKQKMINATKTSITV